MEQIWHWCIAAVTVKYIAYCICIINGSIYFWWHRLFESDPYNDMEWVFVVIFGAFIAFACFLLTFWWVGFPFIVAIVLIYIFLSALVQYLKIKKTKIV